MTNPASDQRTYEQKQADRKKAFAEKAVKLKEEATALYKYDYEVMRNQFPYGQPILVGHHSEKRQRRALERSRSRLRKVNELKEKAAHYDEKSKLVNTAISSDDEHAIPKLKKKLAGLEHEHEKMKRVNLAYRQGKPIEQIDELSDEEKEGIKNEIDRGWKNCPYPTGWLSNIRASIAAVKDRIERLEYRQSRPAQEPIYKSTYTVKENKLDNRIYFLFKGKPAEEVRAVLKFYGFKWSSQRQAWIRMLNANGLAAAKHAMSKLDALEASK